MKATHINYKHPRHLRVEDNGEVFCMSPSCSDYARLAKSSLPNFGDNLSDYDLPVHSSTFPKQEQAHEPRAPMEARGLQIVEVKNDD